MAYTSISKSTNQFNTVLWTGNGVDDRSITGVGFQPDWVFLKQRNGSNYPTFFDSVRGATKRIFPNVNEEEDSNADSLQAFETDGFQVGTNGGVNGNSNTYVAWNWLAGGTSSSNTSGTLTSSVSANTTSGFSICKYTGSTGAQTFGHGLGAVPKMVMIKNLDSSGSGAEHWRVYHASLGASKYLRLNQSDSEISDSGPFSGTTPTSTLVYVGGDDGTTKNGEEQIAYCFAEKTGFSKFGSYTGNGSSDGAFIYTGFKPAFFIIKRTDSSDGWLIGDNKRLGCIITETIGLKHNLAIMKMVEHLIE